MTNNELYKLTLKEASEKLNKGEITSLELTNSVLKRIEEVEPKVEVFITVTKDLAIKQAKESDARREKGKALSPIDGVPIALKDVFMTKGIKTTAASKILEDFIPPFDSTVVKKLYGAGAVIVGKTNTDEFTMGSSTENSAFGPSRNPWDLSRVPGGSSGGSAAAVAADMCMAAFGTDTGGSIRQPSSFCSTVGLKVTYGRVSRYGVISYASSFDTIGPITKTVEDAAILFKIIAGKDDKDATTLSEPVSDYSNINEDLKGLKIGVPKEFYGDGLDDEVRKLVDNAKEELKSLGAEVGETSLPSTKYAIADYYILVKSEASSNLSRYDGIRYGHSQLKAQSAERKTLDEIYINSRTEGFGDEAKRSIMLGTFALSSGYYDAYYLKATKVRAKIMEEYNQVFKKYDVLITPVSPFPAFKIGEKMDDPLSMYLADVNTVPINVAGVPAMSVPAGFTKDNLPVGMQIIAPQLGEEKIFQVAKAFEEATQFYQRKPAL